MKTYLCAAAVLALALSAPAFAQDAMMKCDDAMMMKMQTEMDAMTDADKKKMAMEHMDMAKTAMKDNKMDDCTMHMGNASKTMMK